MVAEASSEEFRDEIFDEKPFYIKGINFMSGLIEYRELFGNVIGLRMGENNGFQSPYVTNGAING